MGLDSGAFRLQNLILGQAARQTQPANTWRSPCALSSAGSQGAGFWVRWRIETEPGTITMGLAEMVHPGEVHGIDMEESQIELARASAEAVGWAEQRHVPCRKRYRAALRGQFLRRGPLSRRLDACTGYGDYAQGSEAGAEAWRHHIEPGDHRGIVFRRAFRR